MTKTRIIAIATLVLLLASLIVSPGATAAGISQLAESPPQAGEWSPPFSEGGIFDEAPPTTGDESGKLPTAVSIAVSPDGQIIYWNGTEGYEKVPFSVGFDQPSNAGNRTRVLDLTGYLRGETDTPTWITPEQERGIGGDLFCSDLRNLADGRLFVVGGTEYTKEGPLLPDGRGRTEAWGLKSARFYDPETGRWSKADPMHYRRWYPSLVSLPDGKMFVAGGVERTTYNDKLLYVNQTETFDPETGKWTENGPEGEATLPFYSRLHLLPSGKIFYDGTGQMWGPWGTTADMAKWNIQKLYDPDTRAWTDVGLAPLGARSGSFSALLPLKPPYDQARIVIGGGTFGPATPGTYLANNLTEIVDVDGDDVKRKLGPPLNNSRWFSSGIVLPSGEVIALNGGDRDDNVFPGITGAVRQAEMFDGEKWTPLASGSRDRLYHSTSILLGDGSILVGGHAPVWATPFAFPNQNYSQGVFSSNFRDPSFEIFKPPYLFRGPRPQLAHVQAGVELGEEFKITTPDAARITSVVLSRLPAVTHLADADQRTIELEFDRKGSGLVEATLPLDPAVALPGHYYLFLMTDNGEGPTPSKAAIVRVGKTDHRAAPLPYGT